MYRQVNILINQWKDKRRDKKHIFNNNMIIIN